MNQDESDFTDEFTGDFINQQPAVFKGLTDSEVKTVFFISFLSGAPIGVFVALLIGLPMLMLVFVFILPIISVWFVATWMERARRGKPPAYVEQQMHIKLVELKLVTASFVCESYRWGLGRTSGASRIR